MASIINRSDYKLMSDEPFYESNAKFSMQDINEEIINNNVKKEHREIYEEAFEGNNPAL